MIALWGVLRLFGGWGASIIKALWPYLLCMGLGAYGWQHWIAGPAQAKLQATIDANAKLAAEAARESRAIQARNEVTAKRIDDENQQQIASMAGYISDFLRKPAATPVPAPVSSTGTSPEKPADGANGSGSGSDHPAPAQPLAVQDPEVTAVAIAGWGQIRLWRQWCRDTPGCVGPELK